MDNNSVEYSSVMDEETAEKELRKNMKKAEKVINDPDRMDQLLQRAEKKLQDIPKVGDTLASIPAMIEMMKDFISKEYTSVPIGTIIAIVAVVIYFVAPIDLIPDCVPGIGYLDDAAVCTAALKLIGSDIEEYRNWRRLNGKEIETL